MKRITFIVVWIVALMLAAPVVTHLVRPDTSPEAVLGQMAVLEGGRVKPLDAVARSTLLLIRGKQSISHKVETDDGETKREKVSAMTWFTDVLFNRDAANALPVFRIDHPDILGMFGLEAGTKKYFTYLELEPYLMKIQEHERKHCFS